MYEYTQHLPFLMTVLETQELCTYLARTSWPHGQGWLVPCWLFSTPLPRRALREGLCLGSAWGAAIKSEKFQPWKIFPLVPCGWSFISVDVNCILSCTCHLLVVPLPSNSVLGLASLLASGPTRLHFVGPSTNTGSSQQRGVGEWEVCSNNGGKLQHLEYFWPPPRARKTYFLFQHPSPSFLWAILLSLLVAYVCLGLFLVLRCEMFVVWKLCWCSGWCYRTGRERNH